MSTPTSPPRVSSVDAHQQPLLDLNTGKLVELDERGVYVDTRRHVHRLPQPHSTTTSTAHWLPFDLAEVTSRLDALKRSDQGSRAPGTQHLPPGVLLTVFDRNADYAYQVPSRYVALTDGSAKALLLYSQYGTQTKARRQLCNKYAAGQCTKGCDCSYVHCDPQQCRRVRCHINEHVYGGSSGSKPQAAPVAPTTKRDRIKKMAHRYQCMHGSESLWVAVDANLATAQANAQCQQVPSQYFIRTLGAEQGYVAQHNVTPFPSGEVDEENMPPPSDSFLQQAVRFRPEPVADGYDGEHQLPRICSHFYFKKACHRGYSCHFLHPLVELLTRSEDSSSEDAQLIQSGELSRTVAAPAATRQIDATPFVQQDQEKPQQETQVCFASQLSAGHLTGMGFGGFQPCPYAFQAGIMFQQLKSQRITTIDQEAFAFLEQHLSNHWSASGLPFSAQQQQQQQQLQLQLQLLQMQQHQLANQQPFATQPATFSNHQFQLAAPTPEHQQQLQLRPQPQLQQTPQLQQQFQSQQVSPPGSVPQPLQFPFGRSL